MKKLSPINELLKIMARLRAPDGCPWDREQNHRTLRRHAIEEVYELIDAIEAGDDHDMAEELGDLLLQVVFHSQMAKERGAFDFEQVCQCLVDKLIHRHPHVFGDRRLHTAEAVLAQWDHLKHAEKKGTRHERASALDGIPKHLPALMRAEKLVKKARKAKLLQDSSGKVRRLSRVCLAKQLFALAAYAQSKDWSAEELLDAEIRNNEKVFRRLEIKRG
jgi:MazG family protein